MSLFQGRKIPVAALVFIVVVLAATFIDPAAGRMSWLLENLPGIVFVVVMLALGRRFPFSDLVWINAAIHVVILAYGGFYTYAETPLGNWAKEAFDLSRNHYDRVGHLALGFFPAIVAREVLLRASPLRRGFWLAFIVVNICNSIGAFWELIEWWTTLVVAGDVGVAFLGAQGDIWDAQWDMFLVLLGSILGLLVLSRAHDRSLAKLEATRAASVQA
ncbi:MAG TPA: DUF2238 domain-containing protein [Myxococcota bacterium]